MAGKALRKKCLNFRTEELKQIRADTEAFAEWAEAPDDPEAVAAIPSLTTDEVAQAPEYKDAEKEKISGIDFYFTEKSGSDVADLFFPIPNENDLLDLQLLLSFLNDRASQRTFRRLWACGDGELS